VAAEPVAKRRRPSSDWEASIKRTSRGHRGMGEGMRAKEERVNTGDPSPCVGESRRKPAAREGPSRAGVEVGEAHTSEEASNDRGAKEP